MNERTSYVCGSCGAVTGQWSGRCARCGEWNTLVERSAGRGHTTTAAATRIQSVAPGGVSATPTGVPELDRVLCGGLVDGSVTLLGGEPGIGKSTLAMQAAGAWAASGRTVLYASAEESAGQVRGRAERLGSLPDDLWLLATDDVRALLDEVRRLEPVLVIVDSVQTMHLEGATSGVVAQVREITRLLVESAKASGVCFVLVGQVTKEGDLAGPKALEHLVDTVLTFEGDRHHQLRFLRAVKHRFGATGEVGLFSMSSGGLEALDDPSSVFLADRVVGVPGSMVVPVIEGHRPVLVEAQALVSARVGNQPRRTAQGLDHGRVGLLAAVLEQRGRLPLHEHDIHTSAVGGVRVLEPAADLGVLLAVASAHLDRPLPGDMVAIGEVGLVGEVRQVNDLERRLKEAARLGFRRAIVPASASAAVPGLEMIPVQHVLDALTATQRVRSISSNAA